MRSEASGMDTPGASDSPGVQGALAKVLALARSYERRTERGKLERVRGYPRHMAADSDHWLISGLALELRDYLDPDIFERLYRPSGLSKAEALNIIDQLTAFKKKVLAAR